MELPGTLAAPAKAIVTATRNAKLRLAGGEPQARLAGGRAGARRIVVIGAGVAGMSAALLLRRAGHSTTVLEARTRPGGRVFTLREPFADGLFGEAGAARIADQHRRTLMWIQHFGLRLEPMYPPRGRLVKLAGGQRLDGVDAAQLSAHDLHHMLVGTFPWDSQFSSGRTRRLITHTLTKPGWYRIAGGMDRLTQAFARELGDDIQFDAPVTRVVSGDDRVEVTCKSNGTPPQRILADYVLCSAPLTTLQQIEFEPALPDSKRAALRQVGSFPALRIYLQLRNRAWMTPGISGYGLTDDGMEIWHPRSPPGTERSLLIVYAQGAAAQPFVGLDPQARIRLAIERVSALFPALPAHCEQTAQFCWSDESWSRGAKAANGDYFDTMAQPAGRVFFTGDGTSADGWIDGSLASSHRAAADILAHIETNSA